MAAPEKKIVVKQPIRNGAFAERGQLDVIKWDVFPIKNGEVLQLVFESVNSTWRQGVFLRCDTSIQINGQTSQSFVLWQDSAPSKAIMSCTTTNGILDVYNVWDSGRTNGKESQAYSSGMIVEELPLGRRYRCNDIGFETKFDKLIFRIERGK